jgi:hypothetical protein
VNTFIDVFNFTNGQVELLSLAAMQEYLAIQSS